MISYKDFLFVSKLIEFRSHTELILFNKKKFFIINYGALKPKQTITSFILSKNLLFGRLVALSRYLSN